MVMRVDIKPQWGRLAAWYWESFDQPQNQPHMSIWDMLSRDYGAIKAFSLTNIHNERGMWVKFPDERSYLAFVLKYS